MITIHNFPGGARGVRLIWQCEEMGLAYRCSPVTFPPNEAYRALNRFGNVPFIEDDGGVAINESVAIMLYLAQRHGPTPLLPGPDEPAAMAKVLQLTVMSEAMFGAAMNTLMETHFGAPAEHKRNWSVGVTETRAGSALAFVEATLGDGDHLVGDRLTLADIAWATALGIWKGALGKTAPGRLEAWRDRVTDRETYQRALAAMPRT